MRAPRRHQRDIPIILELPEGAPAVVHVELADGREVLLDVEGLEHLAEIGLGIAFKVNRVPKPMGSGKPSELIALNGPAGSPRKAYYPSRVLAERFIGRPLVHPEQVRFENMNRFDLRAGNLRVHVHKKGEGGQKPRITKPRATKPREPSPFKYRYKRHEPSPYLNPYSRYRRFWGPHRHLRPSGTDPPHCGWRHLRRGVGCPSAPADR